MCLRANPAIPLGQLARYSAVPRWLEWVSAQAIGGMGSGRSSCWAIAEFGVASPF